MREWALVVWSFNTDHWGLEGLLFEKLWVSPVLEVNLLDIDHLILVLFLYLQLLSDFRVTVKFSD